VFLNSNKLLPVNETAFPNSWITHKHTLIHATWRFYWRNTLVRYWRNVILKNQ